LKNWCSLALKITTTKITTAKVAGAAIFRNVYYRIEATKYRQGDPRNLLEGAAYQVPLRHASGEVLTEYSNVVFSSASTNWHNPVVKEHHHRSRELADFMFSNTPSR
jgi:hypothetical protein